MLRLSFVTGTEPGKWLRRFSQATTHGLDAAADDDPLAVLAAGKCDLTLVRLADERVTGEHHVVRLYDETPGVAVSKDSVFAEVGEPVLFSDLAGEIVNFTFEVGADYNDLRAALQVVAANVGVAYAPLPLLQALSKKQVVPLALRGGEPVPTEIALVWKKSEDSDAIQDFVGVAKGRTLNSSRAQAPSANVKKKNSRTQSTRGLRRTGKVPHKGGKRGRR
ncbi:LysR substrate-binding domain-containing protein [Corynebacterium mayonis]|uniref:LysR substrate-binding domain-containing protein n=1 Tax=Corynebacterium mayonis TaxID=3062461 RepID=UPI00314078F4